MACGDQSHNPEIKSRIPLPQSQSGAPLLWVYLMNSLHPILHWIHTFCFKILPSLLCILHSIIFDSGSPPPQKKSEVMSGGHWKVGETVVSQVLPPKFWDGIFFQLPEQLSPVQWWRWGESLSFIFFFLLRAYSPFILGIKQRLLLSETYYFVNSQWGMHTEELVLGGFDFVFPIIIEAAVV